MNFAQTNHPTAVPQTGAAPKPIPLRQWIKHTVQVARQKDQGSSSSNSSLGRVLPWQYIQSAISVAKSLTNQIHQAEEFAAYGITDQVKMLPVGGRSVDWADYAFVTLKKNEGNNNNGEMKIVGAINSAQDDSSGQSILHHYHTNVPAVEIQQRLSRNTGTTVGNINSLQNLDEKLDAFYSDVDDEPAFAFDDASITDGTANSNGSSQPFEHLAKQPLDGLNSSFCSKSAADVNSFFNVESAQIYCPDGHQNDRNCVVSSDYLTTTKKIQRIYYLGLVFYELFTGGESPNAKLRDLASSTGAFASLSTMTLVKKSCRDNDYNGDCEPKRHQGPSSNEEQAGLCKITFEYLNLLGVPGPLCRLIFNMLDSVYGDLSGQESYTNITDITCDLQLMIDKPDKFLRDIDLNKQSSVGLQWNEIEIPREKEFEAIKSCYVRHMSGSCEIAIIKGESGTGKSWLAYRVGSFVISNGGVFLTGKFDQMQQANTPFSALASAFDQYCDLILREKNSGMFTVIVDNLKAALGQDASHLFKVIPKLEIILGESNHIRESVEYNDDCHNALQRLQLGLARFVEVISVNSIVVLLLDDVQWIDAASLAILNKILRQKQRNFFFLGCCRDDEMASDHCFWRMITSIGAVGIHTNHVKLNCMNEEVLNAVVADLLHLSPRLVRPLSLLLYSKSKGNVLFFLQLIVSLHRDELLYLDFDRQRWAWDECKVMNMELPDNIALCLTNGIIKLPVEVQLALHTMSMFGASVKIDYLELLETQLGLKLIEPLNRFAAAEGLVVNSNDSFRFCHDRIQEASLNLIGEHDRRCNHLAYGKCLANRALDTHNDDMLFTAVGQINIAGPSAISDKREYLIMANHNVAAGTRAISMAEFTSAYSYLKNGILFLPEGHWQDHYLSSLAIFNLAYKSAAAAGRQTWELDILSDQVLKNARSFEDTVEIELIRITIPSYYSSKGAAALQHGLLIVSKLGEEIPSPSSKEALDVQVKQTLAMIKGLSEEHLMDYKIMTDPTKLLVMRLLARLQSIAYFIKPAMNTSITLKMLEITISCGLCPAAPFTFACFGCYLATLGDFATGYRFALLGKSLLAKLGVHEMSGQVFGAVAEIQMYCEPSHAANELRLQGENAAILEGDIHWACINRIQYCRDAFWIGKQLSLVSELLSKTRVFLELQEHKTGLAVILNTHRVVLTISGKDSEATALEALSKSDNDYVNSELKMSRSFFDLYSSYLMNHNNLREHYETYLTTETAENFLLFATVARTFITGLAAFQIYRDVGDALWIKRGIDRMKCAKLWAKQASSWNFEHKLQLMEAEAYYCSGDFEKATESYKRAISSAQAHKYINDEALACELAGKFFLSTNNLTLSLDYLKLAHKKYYEWGAHGKRKQLHDFTKAKFSADA